MTPQVLPLLALGLGLVEVARGGKPSQPAILKDGAVSQAHTQALLQRQSTADTGALFEAAAAVHDADRPTLRFNAEGTFKIVQIADMHYTTGSTSGCEDLTDEEAQYECSDLNTTALINRMLDVEQPDLVVFTGDNIRSTPDAISAMAMAFQPVIDREVPWAAVFGNHDGEANLNRSALMAWITAQPFSLAVPGPDFGELCVGNYRLDVLHAESDEAALTLYLLDSRAYSEVPAISGYDWIHEDQIAWFEEQAAEVAAAAAPAAPPAALAFFHIPLPEYDEAYADPDHTGVKQEDVCSPNVNSGFGAALRRAGTVKAVSVGHDHNNDFCGQWDNIALCYGGGGGYDGYGLAGFNRRSRTFEVTLDGNVTSHKRLDDVDFTIVDQQSLNPYSPDGL